MPTSTACSAMRLERWAMRIASASASTRSTIRTTSAASEDAVAPRAARATPTSAAARAGASFTPSPTMIVAASALSVRDRRQLVGRVTIGQHRVRANDPAHRFRDVRTVASHQDDPLDPRVAQSANHPRRLGTDQVLKEERPCRLTVDRHEHRE